MAYLNYTQKSLSDMGMVCLEKVKKMIFKDKLRIEELRAVLSNEFSGDCVNSSIVTALGDTHYEE